MEQKMETTIMGYIGTAIKSHSFTPRQGKLLGICGKKLRRCKLPLGFGLGVMGVITGSHFPSSTTANSKSCPVSMLTDYSPI